MKEQFKISLDEHEIDVEAYTDEVLPLDLLERKELQWQVMQAIKSLPFQYRMPIILFYYEGLKISQISKVLDITPAVAKNNLQCGRKALKAKFEKDMPGEKYIKISVLIPFVIDKTEMVIAQQRSANVLQALGIASRMSNTLAAMGTEVEEVVEERAAGTLLVTSLWLATVHSNTVEDSFWFTYEPLSMAFPIDLESMPAEKPCSGKGAVPGASASSSAGISPNGQAETPASGQDGWVLDNDSQLEIVPESTSAASDSEEPPVDNS